MFLSQTSIKISPTMKEKILRWTKIMEQKMVVRIQVIKGCITVCKHLENLPDTS